MKNKKKWKKTFIVYANGEVKVLSVSSAMCVDGSSCRVCERVNIVSFIASSVWWAKKKN